MRSEEEMMELILGVAERDERVRAVLLNGSRANPRAPKDRFQDFDIVYFVTEMESFIQDAGWIDVFGERLIMQRPDESSLFPSGQSMERYAYLMLFRDGNRIDLTLLPLEARETACLDDKLTVILLDKDQCLPKLPPPTDEDYWIPKPTEANFADCCNEFWWVSTYAAKGLWRREMLYAQEHMNLYIRPMLIKMLEWQAGILTDFSVSAGKCGKYLERCLPPKQRQQLMATYADGSYEGAWKALYAMGQLFRETALNVAQGMSFRYNLEEDQRVTAYLQKVKEQCELASPRS